MPTRRTIILGLLLVALAGAAFGSYRWLLTDLPSLERLTENLTVPSTKILARDGRLLYQITDPAGVNHTTVPLDEIPLPCQQATIATEDANFYRNPGVDLVGIIRALWINLRGGETLAGGSTITQQVARNMLLDPQERAERTIARKLRESILAWRLADSYAKDEILALYLNQTYYGNLSHGMEAAALAYFGKSVRALDLAQCALLSGLPQAPALYDPLVDPAAAKERQEIVLELMQRAGYLTAEEMALAKREPLRYAATPFPIQAPHFAFYVWSLLERRYGPEVLYSGLTVRTTLDLNLTRAAEAIVRRHLAALAGDTRRAPHNASAAALVALDPHTGQILALVGSPDYFNREISGAVNMALAARQPGSAIKPLTYAVAFDPERCVGERVPGPEFGDCPWTPATMILDVRTSFVTAEGLAYVPQNYDRAYHGPVLAREALGGSLNVPAVIALDNVGIPAVLRLASRMGLTTLSDADRFGLALTLGGGEVRLLDLTSAYAVFATGGLRMPAVAVLEVTDASGRVLERWQPYAGDRVLDERVAFLITSILSDNGARLATFGEFSLLNVGRPAAAKTGTTTDWRDNWTLGYTPELAVGVWVGNPDNSPMVNVSGIDGAAPVWHDFMRLALRGKRPTAFAAPPGLIQVEVCSLSGLLPTAECPHRHTETFIAGTEPTRHDTFHQSFHIDVATGMLATDATPPDRVLKQVFLVLPPAAHEWAQQRGLPLPPDAFSNPAGNSPPLRITSPDQGTVYQVSTLIPRASQQILLRVVSQRPLSQLRLYVDSELYATLTEPPYQALWPIVEGAHTVAAIGVSQTGEEILAEQVRFRVTPPQ